MEESVFMLATELSELYAARSTPTQHKPDLFHYVPAQQKRSRHRALVQRYRRVCFDYILKKRPGLKRPDTSSKDGLLSEAWNLAIRREQVESERLLQLVDSVDTGDEQVDAVLRFILALKNSCGRSEPSRSFTQIGDCVQQRKTRKNDSFAVKTYRTEFRFDVDTSLEKLSSGRCNSYTIFHPLDFCLSRTTDESSPGCGRVWGVSSSPSTHVTPALDTTQNQGVKAKGKIEEWRDEGYSSPIHQAQDSMEIWEDILAVDVSQRRSWQRFGEIEHEPEKPFLSESGSVAVHHLWKRCKRNLELMEPRYRGPRLRVVEERVLCLHIAYLLAGIQTESFFINPDTHRFEIKEGLCIKDLTPECISSACGSYIMAGNIYKNLFNVSSLQETAPGSRILSGFCSGVSRYLRVYSSAVICLGSSFTCLGKLHHSLRPLLDQISLLGSICGVQHDPKGWSSLPSGVELLSLLLRVSVHVSQDQANLTLISLFKAAVNPYFRFLNSWLYSGECDYSFKEFGILMDSRYMNCRTADYWRSTYTLSSLSDNGFAAAFLSDIQEQVFSTGKSLALLRLTCPDHHLSGRYRDLQPQFSLAVTAQDQAILRKTVEEYSARLSEAAKMDTLSLKEKKEKEVEERIHETQLVRLRHEEAAERVRQENEEQRQAQLRLQRQRYDDLQQQAEETRRRKDRDRKKLKEEEEEIEREAERRMEEERRREEEDRRRITEFYERLTQEADDREQRANWRLRRNHPTLKSGRILLNREIEARERNNLSRVGVSKTNQPKAENRFRVEDAEIQRDAEGNFTARFKDDQGNIVVLESLDIFDTYDPQLENQLSSIPFKELPDTLKNKVLHSLELNLLQRRKAKTSLDESPLPTTAQRSVAGNQSTIAELLAFDGPLEVPEMKGNTEQSVDAPDTVRERKKSAHLPIERLLYPHRYYGQDQKEPEVQRTEIVLKKDSKPQPYKKSFPELRLSSRVETNEKLPSLESETFPPLSLILQNSILIPLRAQKKLVDSALLSHLLVDRQLDEHFSALRSYLLLADGEFGRQLVVSLCQLGREMQHPAQLAGEIRQHLQEGAPPPPLLCPTSLNRVLEAALAASVNGSLDPLARNLSFAMRENAERILGIPGLSLGYRATWPLNIVLSEEILNKYSVVLDFMLNIRTSLVSLELDWANENLVLRKDKKAHQSQLHKVNLMRHEMLNFVRNLHSYVAAQVLEVSWIEFQENLLNKVRSLDELIHYHTKYMNCVIFRCLLNPKAAPVLNVVHHILISINKFTSLISNRFAGVPEPTWEEMMKQYQTFQKNSKFLFGLVTKLSSRGYQPHFQDLLVRLNFNGFYDTSLDSSMA